MGCYLVMIHGFSIHKLFCHHFSDVGGSCVQGMQAQAQTSKGSRTSGVGFQAFRFSSPSNHETDHPKTDEPKPPPHPENVQPTTARPSYR